MFFKKEICDRVYSFYLNGVSLNVISAYLDIPLVDINEIIDYMNEINNIWL